jgi:hypothetical protein
VLIQNAVGKDRSNVPSASSSLRLISFYYALSITFGTLYLMPVSHLHSWLQQGSSRSCKGSIGWSLTAFPFMVILIPTFQVQAIQRRTKQFPHSSLSPVVVLVLCFNLFPIYARYIPCKFAQGFLPQSHVDAPVQPSTEVLTSAQDLFTARQPQLRQPCWRLA